jgi:Flp pilus assembly protein CpaB
LLVAARDLAPGAVLGAADLTERHVPAAVRPAGALVADAAALGRILAAPVRRGEPIVDVRLVGGSLYAALGSGLVGAPVRLSDAAEVGLLRPGDVVDVVAAHESGSAAVVAPGARVVGVPAADRGLTAAGGGEGGMVILAVTPSVAVRLAATAADSRLSVVLRPP